MKDGKKIRNIFIWTTVFLCAVGYPLYLWADIPAAKAIIKLSLVTVWMGHLMPRLLKSDNKSKPMIAWIGSTVAAMVIIAGGIIMWLSDVNFGNKVVHIGSFIAIVVWLITAGNEPVD